MTKDEALNLALEALKQIDEAMPFPVAKLAQKVIKEALAQPEQEPLEYWNAVEGWVKIDEVREHFDSVGCGTIYKTDGEGREPLYTTPPQRTWVGLTDKEIEAIWEVAMFANYGVGAELSNQPFVHYARAIEAKLKE
jgi:hypothetical protein